MSLTKKDWEEFLTWGVRGVVPLDAWEKGGESTKAVVGWMRERGVSATTLRLHLMNNRFKQKIKDLKFKLH